MMPHEPIHSNWFIPAAILVTRLRREFNASQAHMLAMLRRHGSVEAWRAAKREGRA